VPWPLELILDIENFANIASEIKTISLMGAITSHIQKKLSRVGKMHIMLVINCSVLLMELEDGTAKV
jgi:hypothetical protein